MPGSRGNARLSWFLLFSFLALAAVDGVERAGPVPPTHSNFLRAALRAGGRHRRLTCGHDPAGVCLDLEKNPWGGGTCCFEHFCKDTSNDPDHCGACGRMCGFAMACCGGECVDLRSDSRHCGSCHLLCPEGAACSFSMCDYGGGGF